ncbi:MAG: hypothetical protein PHX18_01820 [Candidatus Gastranaerophilales bacterium]|nr:hypothetical protein [Candidatus Gastranaerophilales bacterium]
MAVPSCNRYSGFPGTNFYSMKLDNIMANDMMRFSHNPQFSGASSLWGIGGGIPNYCGGFAGGGGGCFPIFGGGGYGYGGGYGINREMNQVAFLSGFGPRSANSADRYGSSEIAGNTGWGNFFKDKAFGLVDAFLPF